ncbi:CaiB/BaiF CoA transferase family protein [Parerythrobacter jejuensis]|uniref:CoA transferase n=1 Tax=Parerythrobacter jejuensis TaxID=795812 RepID=A0A845AJZ3_9SPHN|nr:CoA transferase [Parerythrobacter jejuensis]MXP31062.1 CoA transferase [Parerythrobacter jejuensis]MXP33822.1 CoA transferase [Parerythrobacter jejuensis]
MIAPGDGKPMLEGLKVIDLTSVVFGPYCTQILADFGAEVVKIEGPTGDAYRPGAKPARTAGMGPGFIALNRGKKSLVLDLKDGADAAIMRDLLAEADIFVHNVREAAIERLGFGYEAVKALNPKIIYVHCVGFGSGGPYAGLQAYDDVIQAATGTASLLPRVDGDPRMRYLPSLIADKVAGLHAAYATLAAVTHRLRTGEGQHVEVPMFEAFASFMMKEHLDGKTFDPPNNDAGYARQVDPDRQPFPTKDGWISIVPYTLPQYTQVVALLGDPDLAGEERFQDIMGILHATKELYQRMAALTPAKTTAEWLEILRPHNIPCMPATDINDVIDDPHLRETGFFEHGEHPSEGPLFQMREPNSFSGWKPGPLGHAPLLGEHNDEFGKG